MEHGPNLICDRCGKDILEYYWLDYKRRTFEYTDDNPFSEKEKMHVCWDCDWELMNGDELHVDEYEIWEDRAERAYAEDPINNDPPWGFMGG